MEIKPDMYWRGVNDRTTDLFEGLWPVTDEGVSYNTGSGIGDGCPETYPQQEGRIFRELRMEQLKKGEASGRKFAGIISG